MRGRGRFSPAFHGWLNGAANRENPGHGGGGVELKADGADAVGYSGTFPHGESAAYLPPTPPRHGTVRGRGPIEHRLRRARRSRVGKAEAREVETLKPEFRAGNLKPGRSARMSDPTSPPSSSRTASPTGGEAASGHPPLLRVEQVTKVFGRHPSWALDLLDQGLGRQEILQKTGQTLGLSNVSFTVKRGEFLVVMGLSGSGKSACWCAASIA